MFKTDYEKIAQKKSAIMADGWREIFLIGS